jgi:methylmalonyl-CoA/ethylmalonyl-CoA epimerase
VEDVEAEVTAFLAKGAAMVDQKPRPGAHGSKVAFVHPKSSSGVLIELCEVPKEEHE